MDTDAVVISYHEFLSRFRPVGDGIMEGEPARNMLAAFGSDLLRVRAADPSHVWTVIDVDLTDGLPHPYEDEDGDNCWVIVAGYHYVNRIGYIITELPWEDDRLEVLY